MGRHERERGSSLPEVLVAAALMAVLLAPLVSLFGFSRLTLYDSGRKSGAVNVARTWMERFLAMDWTAMDAYLADPANGFLEVEPGARWVREYAPDPDQPRFEVRVELAERPIRDPLIDDAMPEQLVLRDLIVTVRWPYRGTWYTVQQATTMHRR